MNLIENDYQALRRCLEDFANKLPEVDQTGRLILRGLQAGKTVFACGNGGSATDSMHLCEELVGRYRGDRQPLPAVSLNSDTSVITCIANDFGFEAIFARQIEALGQSGDLLVGFSTSGNSENIYQAFLAAQARGVVTILLTGKDGGRIKEVADHSIVVPSDNTARIQELHTFILHAWLELVECQDWSSLSPKL
ncbi:MAG: SIS domain-containing protein [Coraliomargaritaceae bacterium]